MDVVEKRKDIHPLRIVSIDWKLHIVESNLAEAWPSASFVFV